MNLLFSFGYKRFETFAMALTKSKNQLNFSDSNSSETTDSDFDSLSLYNIMQMIQYDENT